MAILFGCPDCGKTMRVGDNLGGKRCKCPGCGTVLAIPAAEGVSAPREEALPRAKSAPSRRASRFDDDRDERDDDRPRKRRDDDRDDDRPSRKRLDPDDREPAPEEEDELDFKPRKKGKKRRKSGSGMALWIALGGGALVLLAGGGFLTWWLLSGGGLGNELNYFPDNYTSVSCHDVEAMRNSGAYDKLKKKFGGDEGDGWGGIRMDNIRRTISANAKGEYVSILEVKSKVSADSIKEKLKSKFKENKVGDHVIYEPEFGDAFIIDDHLVVHAQAKTLESILKRKGKAKTSERMETAMKKASFKGGSCMVNVDPGGFGTSSKPEFMIVQSKYGSSEVTGTVTAYFRDSTAAAEARKEAEDQFDKMKRMASGDQKDILDRTKISQSGSSVTLTMTIPVDKMDKVGGMFPF